MCEIYPIKWAAEGATTLQEVAIALRAQAGWLEKVAQEGNVLVAPVDNGHVIFAPNGECPCPDEDDEFTEDEAEELPR